MVILINVREDERVAKLLELVFKAGLLETLDVEDWAVPVELVVVLFLGLDTVEPLAIDKGEVVTFVVGTLNVGEVESELVVLSLELVLSADDWLVFVGGGATGPGPESLHITSWIPAPSRPASSSVPTFSAWQLDRRDGPFVSF